MPTCIFFNLQVIFPVEFCLISPYHTLAIRKQPSLLSDVVWSTHIIENDQWNVSKRYIDHLHAREIKSLCVCSAFCSRVWTASKEFMQQSQKQKELSSLRSCLGEQVTYFSLWCEWEIKDVIEIIPPKTTLI